MKRSRSMRMAGAAGAGVGVALAAAAPAVADEFTVTSLADSGPGTLRAAIDDANTNPVPDAIVFQSGLSGTIVVESPLQVDDALNIDGPGADVIAVDGGDQVGIFQVGNLQDGTDLRLAGLSLRNGNSNYPGGAVSIVNSSVSIQRVSLEGNEATAGGAVYAGYESDLDIGQSTLSGNVAASGGAVMSYGSDVDIRSSTFNGNQALQGGGAVFSYATPEKPGLNIVNSTFNRNSGGFAGGAIFGVSGEDPVGELAISSSTISGNMSSAIGGGIGGFFAGAFLENTVVENNFAFYGPDLYSAIDEDPQLPGCGCYPETTFDAAFSFVGNTDGAKIESTVAGSNILDGGDALLGRLADNGGLTRTMAVGPDSPVVNKGWSSERTDQRGETRPVIYPDIPLSGAAGANGADMGAFELQYVAPPPPIPPNGPFVIVDSTPNRKQGTAVVRVEVPAPGKVDLLGFRQLKSSGKYFAEKGTYRFKAVPKGKFKKQLNQRGRARVLVRFRYNPDRGRTLVKSKMFPLFKGNKGKKSNRSALREWRSPGFGPRH